MAAFRGARKRGPWWMVLLAVGVGVLAIRFISGMGGGGSGPPPGTWTSGPDHRLSLDEDGSAVLLEEGASFRATTTWEAPLLHVHLPDGSTISFLREGEDLSRAGGMHAPYRRDVPATR